MLIFYIYLISTMLSRNYLLIAFFIITAHRMCISTMLECMHLCFYIVHVQSVDKNIFGHGIKLHTVLLYIDSIFTIQNFTSSKND